MVPFTPGCGSNGPSLEVANQKYLTVFGSSLHLLHTSKKTSRLYDARHGRPSFFLTSL